MRFALGSRYFQFPIGISPIIARHKQYTYLEVSGHWPQASLSSFSLTHSESRSRTCGNTAPAGRRASGRNGPLPRPLLLFAPLPILPSQHLAPMDEAWKSLKEDEVVSATVSMCKVGLGFNFFIWKFVLGFTRMEIWAIVLLEVIFSYIWILLFSLCSMIWKEFDSSISL
jgi:hypothetical protein